MDINMVAPINTLGYGVVSLNILKSLSKNNKVSLWPIGYQIEAHPEDHSTVKSCMANQGLFNVDAPCLRIYHQHDMAMHVGRNIHTGFPIFELDTFTDIEKHHLSSLDHIFVASKWAKNVVVDNGISGSQITVCPFGVDNKIFHPGYAISVKDNTTTFLNIGKWEVRKGHDILVEAFNQAFTEEDDVCLIMNCYNPFLLSQDEAGQITDGNQTWNNMYKKSKLGNKIRIISQRLASQQEVAKLMSVVDCGVFPARAEGWNLELLEMMACGKWVIATDYAGHRQFCTKENSLLIDIDNKEEAYDGIWFKGQGGWAEIGDRQIDQLVTHMRNIHKRKQSGENLINAAGIETSQALTWEKTAGIITETMNEKSRNSTSISS